MISLTHFLVLAEENADGTVGGDGAPEVRGTGAKEGAGQVLGGNAMIPQVSADLTEDGE